MENMKPHAALLSSPGKGHLIPILELGKRMVTHHGFHATLFVVSTLNDHTSNALLNSSPNLENLDIISLPPVDVSNLLNPNASIPTKLVVTMQQSLPFLRSAVSTLKPGPVMMVVDLFGIDAFSIADEFDMLRYVFNTNNAWFLALTIYATTAIDQLVEDHVRAQKPLDIPGCKPLKFEDTLSLFMDRNEPSFEEFIRLGIMCSKVDGIMVNSWEDLEPSAFSALRDRNLLGRVSSTPVYPIGPLARRVGQEASQEVMVWLDKQPAQSVIYVSFGSGGTLSAQQITELAWGLEMSRQRFIWVVRPPSDKDAHGSFFTIDPGSGYDYMYFLPDGFSTRTHNVGLVVPMWAPQADILSHPSIGGFLSHCGWNSTLESITNGVPMIAWPLYAEQRMNAAMLTEDVRVAIRPREAANVEEVTFGREEIEKTVRKMMEEEEGRELRNRVKELKCSSEMALREGGSSYNSLAQVAEQCRLLLKGKFERGCL